MGIRTRAKLWRHDGLWYTKAFDHSSGERNESCFHSGEVPTGTATAQVVDLYARIKALGEFLLSLSTLFFSAGEYLNGREAPVRGEGCGFKSHLPSQTQTLFGSLMKLASGRRVFASAVKVKG
jgi:hypothetical protein